MGLTRRSARRLFAALLIGAIVGNPTAVIALSAPPYANHPARPATQSDATITFAEIGMSSDTVMQGPFDQLEIPLSLPIEWKLTSGAQLQLDVTAYISRLVPAQAESESATGLIAGRVAVSLNGIPLAPFVIQSDGDQTLIADIPDNAFAATQPQGFHLLNIRWLAGLACDANLSTLLVIRATSRITVPHETVPISPDLSLYPNVVFQQHAAFPAETILLVPAEPTDSELTAAVSIAAGLGRLSDGRLTVTLRTMSQLIQRDRESANIFLIGRSDSLENISETRLKSTLKSISPPSALQNNDGLIQMFTSPWNPLRALIVISGATDSAVLKAARVASGGQPLIRASAQTAIIRSAGSEITTTLYQPQPTFDELGYNLITSTRLGQQHATIQFNIPEEVVVGNDAYLDMIISHSRLVDYLRSGITLRLNGEPMSSLRLSDQSANGSLTRLPLSPAFLKAGRNELEIQFEVAPLSLCADPKFEVQWIAVHADSRFNLPQSDAPALPSPNWLEKLPQPFTNDADLGDIVFVVPRSDTTAWGGAVLLAFDWGAATTGPAYRPTVVFSDSTPVLDVSQSKVVFIGMPADLSAVSDLIPTLPIRFGIDNLPDANSSASLRFGFDLGDHLGYVLTGVDFTTGRSVLALLGTSDRGLRSTIQAVQSIRLIELPTGSNFLLIQDETSHAGFISPANIASQTNLVPSASNEPDEAFVPSETDATTSVRPRWALPVMIVSLGLIVALLSAEMVTALRKQKT